MIHPTGLSLYISSTTLSPLLTRRQRFRRTTVWRILRAGSQSSRVTSTAQDITARTTPVQRQTSSRMRWLPRPATKSSWRHSSLSSNHRYHSLSWTRTPVRSRHLSEAVERKLRTDHSTVQLRRPDSLVHASR